MLIKKLQGKNKSPSSAHAQQILKGLTSLADEEYEGNNALKSAHGLAYKNNQIPDSPFDQRL